MDHPASADADPYHRRVPDQGTILMRKKAQVPGLNGLRFMAHVWVIAFHCLQTNSVWAILVKNGDSGTFDIMTGLTTELSLEFFPYNWLLKVSDEDSSSDSEKDSPKNIDSSCSTALRSEHASQQPPGIARGIMEWFTTTGRHRAMRCLRYCRRLQIWYFRWLIKRVLGIFVITWLTEYVALKIFPERRGIGKHLLFYVFTGLLPFLERFSKDRIVWNPNPVHWFICQLLLFWMVHPILRPVVNKLLGQTRTRLWSSFLCLGIGCTVFCLSLEPYAEKKTGWSFHPLPRALQYLFGIWAARVVIMETKLLIQHEENIRMHKLLKPDDSKIPSGIKFAPAFVFMPDILFTGYLTIESLGVYRYEAAWFKTWLWKSIGITPLLTAIITSYFYTKWAPKYGPSQIGCLVNSQTERDSSPTLPKNALMNSPPSTHHALVNEEGNSNLSLMESTKMKQDKRDDTSACVLSVSDPEGVQQFTPNNGIHIPPRECFHLIFFSRSLLMRLYENRWIASVAPGHVNFVCFLIHFPVVWQFGKVTAENGKISLIYCLTLYWMSLWCHSYLLPLLSFERWGSVLSELITSLRSHR